MLFRSQTEVNPLVGTQEQAEALSRRLTEQFESDREGVWETEVFGRTLDEVVREGMDGKLTRLPEDVRAKLKQALEKIVNEGSGGMICILL